MKKEKKLTDKNAGDVFKCSMCGKPTTRGEILIRWTSIPFCEEDKKKYYCGCIGWN